jgi:hypothetical protein
MEASGRSARPAFFAFAGVAFPILVLVGPPWAPPALGQEPPPAEDEEPAEPPP